MNELHYDIISDIHGRFDKLAALMERMGYQPAGEGFIPPTGHKALFLGDLIDTKPGQLRTMTSPHSILRRETMCRSWAVIPNQTPTLPSHVL